MPSAPVHPNSFEIALNRLNDTLFKNRLIIIGSINTTIVIIPSIPDVLLMRDKLVVTDFKASFTEAPTNGTRLLIANRAVLIDKESAPCAIVFLYEKTNIKTDIEKTVIDEKVTFNVFEIPLKSHALLSELMQPNERQADVIGSINLAKKLSMKEMKSSIELLVTIALVVLPVMIVREIIIGVNEFITFDNKLTNVIVDFESSVTTPKIHKETDKVVSMENEKLTFCSSEDFKVLKKLSKIINSRNEAKLFKTFPIPPVKYSTAKLKKLFSSMELNRSL